jgi:hypothetical protein
LAKDIDFSGFKSQNPLIERNQVRTRNIDTRKIVISIVEKNNVGVNSIPQILEKCVSSQKENLDLVYWTQTQFFDTVRADLDSKIFEERQRDKIQRESETLISEIKKILG